MCLPDQKTKIVCTIGPACRSVSILSRLIESGMNVARLNFSHGDIEQHERDIDNIRKISCRMGRAVAIMADLPGPKIRIGNLVKGSMFLGREETVHLTTRSVDGEYPFIPIDFDISSVSVGDTIYLSDGFMELEVTGTAEDELVCRVVIGGELLSHKGIALPGTHLEVDAVTPEDERFIDFALEKGIDAVGVSFAGTAGDIEKVRSIAVEKSRPLFIIAKIERKEGLDNIDEIIRAADGVMVARGDLGVQMPLAEVPLIQKRIILKANIANRPVIIATQMLESMVDHIRPTRAEVTDVANAILDGTDAVMLSEETAIGSFPVECVRMLASIAQATESGRGSVMSGSLIHDLVSLELSRSGTISEDVIALEASQAVKSLGIGLVLAPTISGGTPRRISRLKNDAWIMAFCGDEHTRNCLAFSYGVVPVVQPGEITDDQVVSFAIGRGLAGPGQRLLLVRRLPEGAPGKINSLEIITLNR